jgi:hypothetical protein
LVSRNKLLPEAFLAPRPLQPQHLGPQPRPQAVFSALGQPNRMDSDSSNNSRKLAGAFLAQNLHNKHLGRHSALRQPNKQREQMVAIFKTSLLKYTQKLSMV